MIRLRASFALAAALATLIAPGIASAQASAQASGQASGLSDPALWRFVYPNAKALISVDWAGIRQSPAGAMLREKWLNAGDMPAVPGMELLNDIDRVLISSPGKNSPDDAAEKPILVAIRGHFDAARVRQVFTRFGAKPQSYNSFQVYRPQRRARQGDDAKDTAWVLFDAQTILYGDAPSIFAALDRNRFAPASPPQSPQSSSQPGSLVARAAEMEAGYEFWMIVDATEVMSSDLIAALFQGGEWASEADGFEIGVNLRAGLAADITVRFSSDATAKRVTAELTRVVNLAAKDKSTGAELRELARKLKFGLDGSATKISLRLTQQELQRSVEAFAESHKAVPAVAENGAGNAGSPPVAAAKPAVIRIEGLDEGPREIPFEDPRH
jgi:hypothetical protein